MAHLSWRKMVHPSVCLQKGHTRNYRKFESENDACKFFYQVLEEEMKYYRPVKK